MLFLAARQLGRSFVKMNKGTIAKPSSWIDCNMRIDPPVEALGATRYRRGGIFCPSFRWMSAVTELIEDEKVRRAIEELIAEKIAEKNERIAAQEKWSLMLIAEKDERIKDLQNGILSLKGLLTARGVFEYFADGFLKIHVIGNKRRMSIADIIRESAKMAYESRDPPDDIKLFKDAYETCIKSSEKHNALDCESFYKALYGELSKEIHEASWSGPGVKNTLSKVPDADEYICVLAHLFEQKFNLALD